MNQIIDSNSTSTTLVELVETYISQKRDKTPTDTTQFRKELKQLGYSEDQQQDILIEMDDDSDKELLAGIGLVNAKKKFTLGLIIGVLGIILCIVVAFSGVSMGIFFIPFGIIGAAFITAGQAHAEIGLVEKRKKRRALKYQNWI